MQLGCLQLFGRSFDCKYVCCLCHQILEFDIEMSCRQMLEFSCEAGNLFVKRGQEQEISFIHKGKKTQNRLNYEF